jgi:hypothetical protein
LTNTNTSRTLYTDEQIQNAVREIAEIFRKDKTDGSTFEPHNPLMVIHEFLLGYSEVLLDVDSNSGMTKEDVINMYDAYHKQVISQIRDS